MTIIFQTIGAARYGVFLSTLRQGLLYIPFLLLLPRCFGIWGIYAAQPVADLATLAVSLLSFRAMKRICECHLGACSGAAGKGR